MATRTLLRRLSTARVPLPDLAPASQAVLSPLTNLASLRNTPPTHIVAGSGVYVQDASGKKYLEAVAGMWCTMLGWGNEELVETVAEQTRQLGYYHSFTGKRVPVVDSLSEELIARAPAASGLRDGGRVFLGLSGSDANDTQVRLIWHYNHLIGKPQKRKFITRDRAYHGCSVSSGSLTGLPHVHTEQGLPLPWARAKITCPSYYREGRPGESEADFVARLASELDEAIIAEGGSEEVAALFAEPVQGAGGVVVPPKGYFEAIQAVCAKHDVLVVADEVITGFGRTGQMWGSETMGVAPDLISSAKQLTSAYAPLSAVMLPGYMYDAFEAQTAKSGGVFGLGYTYSGHPVSCAVALKVLEIMDRDAILTNVQQSLSPAFMSRMSKLSDHPLVGESRGVGMIGALELVADKATKARFPKPIGPLVMQAAHEQGLIVRVAPVDNVCLCPPLVITVEEIDELFDRLEVALDVVAAQVL